MEYFIQADFEVSHYYPLPAEMTLCDFENHEIVKSYNVKWDTLYITYSDYKRVEINPIKDPDYFNFFKHPSQMMPIGKFENDWIPYKECCCCCCGKCVSI